MDKQKIHMSGGLYFAILSDTFKVCKNKRRTSKNNNVLNNCDYFIELIRTLVSDEYMYIIVDRRNLKTEVANYKYCNKKWTKIILADCESKRKYLMTNAVSNYNTHLQKTKDFLEKYIDLSQKKTLLEKLELITKIIIIDSRIGLNNQFFVKANAEPVTKKQLLQYFRDLTTDSPNVDLAAYLLGIGLFTVLEIENNKVAADTCDWLFPKTDKRNRSYIEPKDIDILIPKENNHILQVKIKFLESIKKFAHGQFIDSRDLFLRPSLEMFRGRSRFSNKRNNIYDIPLDSVWKYLMNNTTEINEVLLAENIVLSPSDEELFTEFEKSYLPIIDYFINLDKNTTSVDFFKVMRISEVYEYYWQYIGVEFENAKIEFIKNMYLLLLNILLVTFETESFWWGDADVGTYDLLIFTEAERLKYLGDFMPHFEFCKSTFELLKKHLNESYFIH